MEIDECVIMDTVVFSQFPLFPELSKYNKPEMWGRSSTCWYSNLNTQSVKHYSAVFLHLYYLYLFSLLCKTDQQKSERLFSSMKVYV